MTSTLAVALDYLGGSSIAIGALVWRFLPSYLERYLSARIVAAAKGAVDEQVGKSLAEHGHELTKQLEQIRQSLALDRERYSRDYGLFAEKRNAVYAETYAALERAAGGFSTHLSALQITTDFRRSPREDLEHLAARLELVSEGERAELRQLLKDGDLDRARTLANSLHARDGMRRANRAFSDFRNVVVLHQLYFTPEIDELLTKILGVLAHLSVYLDELLDDEKHGREEYRDREGKLSQMRGLVAEVRTRMRAEMTAGFAGDQSAPPVEA